MRVVRMAGASSLLRMTFSSSSTTLAKNPHVPFLSLRPPTFVLSPLNLSSHVLLLSTIPHSSPSSLLSTLHHNNSVPSGRNDSSEIPRKDSKVLLKEMRYLELEKWVKSHGYRSAQALMLWKRLYGDNLWAHSTEELEGLNKDFKQMLRENAELKAVHFKDIITASDGTRKDISDFIHIGRWTGNRNRCNTLP